MLAYKVVLQRKKKKLQGAPTIRLQIKLKDYLIIDKTRRQPSKTKTNPKQTQIHWKGKHCCFLSFIHRLDFSSLVS
jgi:hypothetical protein